MDAYVAMSLSEFRLLLSAFSLRRHNLDKVVAIGIPGKTVSQKKYDEPLL